MKGSATFFSCSFLVFLLLLAAFGLQGCSFYTMHGQPSIDRERLARKPPASLAIMPVRDTTDREGLDRLVRRSLYGALAPLHYKDLELDHLDETLASMALKKNVSPLQLQPQDLAQAGMADAVLYTEVIKRSRLWLFLYSHLKLRMRLSLLDPSDGAVLYSNDATLSKRRFSLPLSIGSIATSWVETLWDIRNSETEHVLDEFSDRIAKEFPDPAYSATEEGGIDAVFVSARGSLLHAGDTVEVEVRGRPGMKGWFDVGPRVKNQPLIEKEAGFYTGTYRIAPGDQDETGIVQAFLQAPDGRVFAMSNLKQNFRIDAVPPERPEIQSVQLRKSSVALQLALPRLAPGTHFEVYRSVDPQKGYESIGQISDLEWTDKGIKPNTTYWYLVKAIDAGGNASLHSEPRKVDVPQKGPTLLPPTLNGNITLHAYSSPYQVMQTVTVAASAALQVEPGVKIEIWPGARIRVQGSATIHGSLEAPVGIAGKGQGGTLLQFEPGVTSQVLSLRNVHFGDALLALDLKGGSTHLEKVRFKNLVRGISIVNAIDIQLLQCEFDSVSAAAEGTMKRFDAQFCSLRGVEAGFRLNGPHIILRNNDFHGTGIAVSQKNAAPVQIDDNYFGTTDPIALLGRALGPCQFVRLCSKPAIFKQYRALESASFDLCKARGDGSMERKDLAGALHAYLNAWWLCKDRTVGMRLVSLFRSAGNPEQALHVAHTLVTMEPSNPEILAQYSRALDEAGYTKESVEVRKRMARTPDADPFPK